MMNSWNHTFENKLTKLKVSSERVERCKEFLFSNVFILTLTNEKMKEF